MTTTTAASSATPLRRAAAARPWTTTFAVTAGFAVIGAGLGLVVRAVRPGTSGETAALLATGGLAVYALVLVRTWRDGAALGLTRPGAWRRPAWLLVPAVVALLPLAGGFVPTAGSRLAVLVVGYALTGLAEEGVWRGVVLHTLLPRGPRRAVLASSALFGLVHLVNLVYRDSAGLVLLQVWGAFCFGVGYAAIRLRTGALWPLMITHAVLDLLPRVCGLSGLAVYVVDDVLLLMTGLALVVVPGHLRREAIR